MLMTSYVMWTLTLFIYLEIVHHSNMTLTFFQLNVTDQSTIIHVINIVHEKGVFDDVTCKHLLL